jgi:hypothetical protein
MELESAIYGLVLYDSLTTLSDAQLAEVGIRCVQASMIVAPYVRSILKTGKE